MQGTWVRHWPPPRPPQEHASNHPETTSITATFPFQAEGERGQVPTGLHAMAGEMLPSNSRCMSYVDPTEKRARPEAWPCCKLTCFSRPVGFSLSPCAFEAPARSDCGVGRRMADG